MSINLVAVTALGGVPLFTRNICLNKLNETSIPFATLAALNGVNLFSRLNNANLMSTETRDSRISWKVFKGSIVLIVISTTDSSANLSLSEANLNSFLDLVFAVLVMSCGLNEIIGHNIEKLKRCLKNAYLPLDYVLKQVYSFKSLAVLTQRVEYRFTDSHFQGAIEPLLESCCQMASTNFGCIMANKKVVAATKQWWMKLSDSTDAVLVTILVNSFPASELQKHVEMPIYLPTNCPNAVTRVIAAQIFKNVVLVLLCGEHPSAEKVEADIVEPLRVSKAHHEQFKAMQKEIKFNARLDENIMGLMVMRHDLHIIVKCGNLDDAKLREMVKLIDVLNQSRLDPYATSELHAVHQNCKFYVVFDGKRCLLCTYPLDVPLNKMRDITLKTFLLLIKEKKLWPHSLSFSSATS